jgi:arylsulfatase A-like enzyme/Tfp pilus assembly protein PilF
MTTAKRLTTLGLLLICALAASSCTESDAMKFAKEQVALGEAALDEDRLEDALTAYRRAVAQAPRHMPGHLGLGRVLVRIGRADEAIREFEIVSKEDPQSGEALTGWAFALTQKGQLAKAEEMYERALQTGADIPAGALADYAILLSAQRRSEAALGLFERAAVDGMIDRADAMLHWGATLERTGKVDEAIERYEIALVMAPDDPSILNNLGFLLFRQGRERDRAIGMMQRAVAQNPGSPMLLHNLGWALLASEQFDEAHSLLRRAAAATSPEQPIYALRLQHLQQAADKLTRGSAPADAPNVLLIVLDTLRADHLGTYGYDRPTSPGIDAWAKRGVVFERAISQAPWTAASIASLFTSLQPSVHGLNAGPQWGAGKQSAGGKLPFAVQSALGASQLTLAEILRRDGYATAGFISNIYVNSIFGFAQGFDVYDDEHGEYSRNVGNIKRRASKTNERIFAWLDQRADRDAEPFFLFAHYNDAHWPYVPPAPFGTEFVADYTGELTPEKTTAIVERAGRQIADLSEEDLRYIVGLYDGELQYLDSEVTRLIQRVERQESSRDLLVVITADHGEEFLDHGSASHGYTLYDEQLHVPLMIRMPGIKPGRVSHQVRSLDVMPTILELAGVSSGEYQFQGVSLRPLLDGDGSLPGLVAFSEAAYRGDQAAIASADGWKMIRDKASDTTELFDLKADPREQNDRAGDAAPSRTAELAAALEQSQLVNSTLAQQLGPAQDEGSVVLDEATQDQLEALGYIND